MTSPAPIRLLVADDHPIVTQGMQRFFSTSTEHSVEATATCVSEVLERLAQHDIDIVILDIQMPGLTGPEAVSTIANTGVKIILYSLMAEDAMVASLAKAGASGFVSKTASLDVLSEATGVVQRGDTFWSETMDKLLSDSDPPHLGFTARELEIYELLARGNTPKEAAFELGIATSTVYTYTERIRQRLEVASIAEIVNYAKSWRKWDDC